MPETRSRGRLTFVHLHPGRTHRVYSFPRGGPLRTPLLVCLMSRGDRGGPTSSALSGVGELLSGRPHLRTSGPRAQACAWHVLCMFTFSDTGCQGHAAQRWEGYRKTPFPPFPSGTASPPGTRQESRRNVSYKQPSVSANISQTTGCSHHSLSTFSLI